MLVKLREVSTKGFEDADDRPQILIVDDEPDVVQTLMELLNTRLPDFAVECFATGDEALERIRAGPVDAAIVDFRMPETNGIEVMRRLAADQPTARSIMFTAYGDFDLVKRSVNEGNAARFIRKPGPPEDLLAAIEECAWEGFLARISGGDPDKAEAWVRAKFAK